MRKFGLIGSSLSHSFSKDYFSRKFDKEGIEATAYELYELPSINALSSLIKSEVALCGLNVTIPFKESVIPFLNETDHTAGVVKAVNTIKIDRSGEQVTLKGYNTDIIGFRDSLKPFLAKEHNRALILGTGGAAKAVSFVLKQLDIPHFFVSRKASATAHVNYSDLDEKILRSFPLLINTTPLGMHPNTESMPPIPLEGISDNHLVYDLVYNPKETLLLKEAAKRGAICVNGLSMLQLQAEAAWKIWNE
jgi:shikimate dehydrogenase